MARVLKLLCLWFILGMFYFTLEGLWRGSAHISMLAVGGLGWGLVGGINQWRRFYKLKVALQASIGTVIILVVELAAGWLLNIKLDMGIWDYSHMPFNFMGQICPQYALLWFFLAPFAIWLEDFLVWKLWGEGEYYSLVSVYREFICFK